MIAALETALCWTCVAVSRRRISSGTLSPGGSPSADYLPSPGISIEGEPGFEKRWEEADIEKMIERMLS